MAVLVMEGALWFAHRRLGLELFTLLEERFGETLWYGGQTSTAPGAKPTSYDPDVGWNFLFDERSDFKNLKETKFLFFGDSFTYGYGVSAEEAFPGVLRKRYGDSVSVLNLAVSAYGLDQMVLLARKELKRYPPSLVVISFIADDLRRSCNRFAWGLVKPYYRLEGEKLVLENTPAPDAAEVFKSHQKPLQKLADKLTYYATRSRLVRLVGQAALLGERKRCLNELGPAILKHARELIPAQIPVYFAHLDGELPPRFAENARKQGVAYLSIPAVQNDIAKSMGLKVSYQEDGHPTADLHRVYAEAIHRYIDELQGGNLASLINKR